MVRKATKKQTEETDENVMRRLFPKEIVKAVRPADRTKKPGKQKGK